MAAQAEGSPDDIWYEILAEDLAAYKDAYPTREYWVQPDKFRVFSLDKGALDKVLGEAPPEALDLPAEARPLPALIYLPTPDGEYMAFEFVESPVMAPDLAAKFPEITTYAGTSVEDPSITVRFDYTPAGFHAQVLAPGARWHIDPHYKGDTNLHVSYYRKDLSRPDNEPAHCLVEGEDTLGGSFGFAERSGDTLRTYRLAVATTGEYGVYHGGTSAGALAAVVTTINRVTGIYEKEVAIRLTLIGNNDSIMFTNPATDPFDGNNNVGVLNGESQEEIDDRIGAANYDIGHTFGTGPKDGSAWLGSVCNDSVKARGVTTRPAPVGDAFDVDYVAHEIGHQFGANHTFNWCGGNRVAATAYEPGSGSTILGYAGLCGANDLQANSDPIFHSESHAEIISYINGGGACGTTTALGNAIPTAAAGSDYTIPAQTPFRMVGSGSDADADSLTYLWEERDLGPSAALAADDDGEIPLFRTFTPTAAPERYLPRLTTLASNTTDNAEKVPEVARTMVWRFTVRDNKGGVDSDDALVTVSTSAGPFLVTSPNGGENESGTTNIAWNVASTTSTPVSTANVDIFLSIDGGATFDTANPLASSTPNDGSHSVVLPDITSNQARIMVKGSNNIFFDVSNQNFNIVAVPNLIVTSPAVTDNTLTTGQVFTFGATVQNQGQASSSSTTLRYFRSTDSTISTADTELSTDPIAALSPGASSAQSDAVSIGSVGTFWVGACVNAVSGESNTSNQCSSGVQVTVSLPAVDVTVATNATGRSITVDGTAHTAPQTFTWTVGGSHTISTSSPQLSGDQKTQYTYASWSDGGAQSHSITVPASNTTYTASFTFQYRLDTVAESAAGGTVTPNPVGPWHNPNQVVQVAASVNADHFFHSWGGDCEGQGNPCSVTMTGPKNATGNFPSNSCVTDLVLTNQTLSGTQVLKASNRITLGANTTIASGANIELRSKTSRLDPGFSAQGTFTMTSVSIPCL